MTACNDNESIRSIVESEVIRDLKAQLGRANALCRIRFDRIRELEAQLEAIGAGGVGPLMGAWSPDDTAHRPGGLPQTELAPDCQQSITRRLTREQWESIAHRTASRYSHRSDPHYIAYTFLPHTLEDFVIKLQDAIEGASSDHPARHP